VAGQPRQRLLRGRVGDHDHPLAFGRGGGTSRFDVVGEPREWKLDRDPVVLPVPQFGEHSVPAPGSMPRTMDQDDSRHPDQVFESIGLEVMRLVSMR
jgi:hypothetical protein